MIRSQGKASRDNRFRHTFPRAFFGAAAEQFALIPPGRSRRAPVRGYSKKGRRSALKTGHKSCTKRRFITFYQWPVKPPPVRKVSATQYRLQYRRDTF